MPSQRSLDNQWFSVYCGLSIKRFEVFEVGVAIPGVTQPFKVRVNLSLQERESVALSIFHDISLKFETIQGGFPWNLVSDSSYSAEDLVSNLVGFYRVVRGSKLSDLGPVSKATAEKVWDDSHPGGLPKNKSMFQALIFPCAACGNPLPKPMYQDLPPSFASIKIVPPGELWGHDVLPSHQQPQYHYERRGK